MNHRVVSEAILGWLTGHEHHDVTGVDRQRMPGWFIRPVRSKIRYLSLDQLRLIAVKKTEVRDMSSKVFTKRGSSGEFSTFRTAKDGGLAVDREKLHQSVGYKRQVDALVELSQQMRSKKK